MPGKHKNNIDSVTLKYKNIMVAQYLGLYPAGKKRVKNIYINRNKNKYIDLHKIRNYKS